MRLNIKRDTGFSNSQEFNRLMGLFSLTLCLQLKKGKLCNVMEDFQVAFARHFELSYCNFKY